jgi:chemotaxis protein methyltransferase CheR
LPSMMSTTGNAKHSGGRWDKTFPPMTASTFSRLASFIHAELGIKMPDVKRSMLQGRLQKRMRHLGLGSYEEYVQYVFTPEGVRQELPQLINSVTTNKTDFFREPKHYDVLVRQVLPRVVDLNSAGLKRKLKVWSAACSTGEEPYTLAMVLREFEETCPGFHFSILATDISTKVLEKAIAGIYGEEKIEPVPQPLRKKYLLRGKDGKRGLVRIVPELRSLVRFQRLNLMEKDYGLREAMDVIFCRNVIIYFDRPTQEKVLGRLVAHLRPGGYLFMGHSETLNGFNMPLAPIALTVYRKIE